MTPLPLGLQLTSLAEELPDAPALTIADVTSTFGQLEQEANQLARYFESLGVRQGDRVTIALPNSREFVSSCFAVWKLGAVPQPISPRLSLTERRAIVDLARPSLLLGAVDEEDLACASLPAGFRLPPGVDASPLDGRVSPSWKAMNSGGSTGRPKLIESTTSSLLDPEAGRLFQLRDGGCAMAPGPLYHNTPFQLCHTALLMRNHVVLSDRFRPEETLTAVEGHRVDVLSLVPTMMLRILRHLETLSETPDLSSLRVVWHMAAPCPAWVKEAWMDLIGPDRLWELYGGTELISVTTIRGDDWLEHRGSVGRPLFGDMVILGEDGQELPRGEVGEIYMRPDAGVGPSFRYLGAMPRTHGEWSSLGDLGWMDKEGYVYLSDRRTDLVLVGGANVFPAEVEAVLMEHGSVYSAIVVGLPDEDLGQVPHAVVETRGELTELQLRAFLDDRLVRYKQPRSFRFVREPLRDDAGKARRTAIQAEEEERLRASAAGTIRG